MEDKQRHSAIFNTSPVKVSKLINNIEEKFSQRELTDKKEQKYSNTLVKQACDSLHSLQIRDNIPSAVNDRVSPHQPLLLRKNPIYAQDKASALQQAAVSSLDNPIILEQQLEALEYHKKQLEKQGKLNTLKKTPKGQLVCDTPKLSSTSLLSSCAPVNKDLYRNDIAKTRTLSKTVSPIAYPANSSIGGNIYSNIRHPLKNEVPLPTRNEDNNEFLYNNCGSYAYEEEIPPPPSPVSSSYSELRHASEVFKYYRPTHTGPTAPLYVDYGHPRDEIKQIAMPNDYSSNDYGSKVHTSSSYESIYEPVNPRQQTNQMNMPSNCVMYPTCGMNGLSTLNGSNSDRSLESISSSIYSVKPGLEKNDDVDRLTEDLIHSMNSDQDQDTYGICCKCNERVVGENSGCTAMDQIFHIACFTCFVCQINLQGRPFYALDDKPYCEYDYLQTLEKCSICMKPILERILRATGKPFHPQCFTCLVCKKSLDGIPFTVDATNQNYCIEDFHKKFAPRCCVCNRPIMPKPGEEETVRVVALDRSFHFECYKCEDCGLLLSSEAEGRGCYPLDDHVLCKNCNAQRVQNITKSMNSEL